MRIIWLSLLVFIPVASFAQRNPDILAEFRSFVKKSEALQKGDMTNEKASDLYFIDKKLLDLCPEENPEVECVKYLTSNSSRFGKGDGGRYIKDYWLNLQSTLDSKSWGDYKLDRLQVEFDKVSTPFGASVPELTEVKEKIDNWLVKYPKHARTEEASKMLSIITKQLEWRRSGKSVEEYYRNN